MDWQSALTGIVVVGCAAVALRRFMGTGTRAWLAAAVRPAPGGARVAAWLVPLRTTGSCGGCEGCESPALRGIPVRLLAPVPAQETAQRPCGAASHWRASSTQ